MPEPGHSEVDPKIPRRSFFAAGLKVLLGAGVGVKIAQEVSHEQRLTETGEFETATAIWRPIYETHSEHVQAIRSAPFTGLSALSVESFFSFSASMMQLLTGNTTGLDTIPNTIHPSFPPDVLQRLKTGKVSILFGDVTIKQANANIDKLNILRDIVGVLTPYTIIRLGTAIESKLPENHPSRRTFMLKATLAGILAGAAFVLPPSLHRDLMEKNMSSFQQKEATQRIWARLNSLNATLLPEDLNDLFREMVQANKLLLYADIYKGFFPKEKPKIGFNWHIGHRGIEDWLRVDRALIRACILAYPDEVLRAIIRDNNNDPRCLYAIRVMRVPQTFTETVNQRGTRIGTFDPKESPSDDVFEDLELQKALIERGLVQNKGSSGA